MVQTYKAWIVLLPLCLLVMSPSSNVAENTPIANPRPLDEEAEDVEAITRLLEAAKAKNVKIVQKKKEHEEAKCKADEAEAKCIADKAKAKWARNVEEACKRKVSAMQISRVPG